MLHAWGWVQRIMLADAAQNIAPISQAEAQDDMRVLSLAESVGNMGHWYWQTDTDAMTWSDQVYAIFGRSAADYKPVFQSFLAHFQKVDRDRVYAQLRQALESQATFEFDARIVASNGQIRNIIAKGQPEVDDEARVVGVFGVITDVTEAFQTLQAIRDQKEMLDLAARVSGLGHWVWDPDQRRLAFCSDHLADMFGATAAELISTTEHPSDFAKLICEEDRVGYAETVRRQVSTIESYETEYRCVVHSQTRHFREIGQPIVGDDGELQRYIATVQDITVRRMREAELEAARRELESVVAAKDQLFSIIGHDLKSSFNNIIGFSSLLTSEDINLPPERVTEYGRLITTAAQNTNELLDTLLAWAATESGTVPFKELEFDLASAFSDGVRPLIDVAADKQVTIESALDDMYVKADRDMVMTIFRNLINNAIKFCRSGDKISVHAVRDKDKPGFVKIDVADTGVGMDGEKARALISDKRRSSTSGTAGETGSGLGLRLCTTLVKRHGCDLTLQSAQGEGCTVTFWLSAPD
jgi:PAS domain S-box-containing protein